MLNAFRRHAYSWVIRGILILIVGAFMFWGIGSGLFNQIHPIASIDGQTILADQVDREATRLRRSIQQLYGTDAAEALKKINFRQEALQQLIDSQLIDRDAHRIGLEVSDADLQNQVAATKAFQVDGQFDFATYQAVLRENDLDPADYEADERRAMTADLLRQMVEQGVQVSSEAARFEFDQRNAQLALAYIEVPYSGYTARMNPTDKQIADYYKADGEQFREPERVKILFVDYAPSILAATVNPADKDIEDYYYKNQSTAFTHPFQVHARHILVAVPAGTSDAEKKQAKAKAEEILHQVKTHPGDFAKLARLDSDDPGNNTNGGDLGFFGRGQMVKPFEDAVFKLKPGEVTMVETQFGYHVVRAEESRPARVETLAEARPEIVDTLRRKAGGDLARKALHDDLSAAIDGQDIKELATKRGLEAIETPFFAAGEPIKGTPNSEEIARAAFKLEPGATRVVTTAGTDSYLVKLLERAPSRIPPLKEIEPRVREALVKDQAERAARDFAMSILKQIKTPADFAQVAASNKLEVHNTGEFNRADGSLPVLGRFTEVTDAAGSIAKVPGVIDRAMDHDGDSYLFELLSRRPPDDEQWKKDGPAFTQRILEQRREQAWSSYLEGLKERARITIDANQLAESTES
jgi:peptidyl-prolyl cis-trans isomerase D